MNIVKRDLIHLGAPLFTELHIECPVRKKKNSNRISPKKLKLMNKSWFFLITRDVLKGNGHRAQVFIIEINRICGFWAWYPFASGLLHATEVRPHICVLWITARSGVALTYV